MNKKHIRFIICMILSMAILLMMSVGVFADNEDTTLPEGDGTTVDQTEEGVEDGTEGVEGDDMPVVDGVTGEETESDDRAGEGFLGESEIKLAAYDDYTYICGDRENGLAMYYDKNSGIGLFYLEKIVDGKKVRWYSTVDQQTSAEDPTIGESIQNMRSHIAIESVSRAEMANKPFAEERTSRYDCIGLNGETIKNVTVKQLSNGLKITYHFAAVNITVPVMYTLEDGKFYATIVVDEIDDGGANGEHVLVNVNVLPAFGAGNWNDNGYVLVPDGSGALMEFNNGAYRELGYRQYEAMVYGDDMAIVADQQVTYTEDIRLPVFGIVNTDTDTALYGVITEGDGASSIIAMSGNFQFGYNGASSMFHYRVMQKQYNLFNKRDVNLIAEPKFEKGARYRVRYDVLTGDDADYIGIAAAYREYLKDDKGLKKVEAEPTFHLDAVGAFEQAATFLGIIPYTDTVSLTTYEQCTTILGELNAGGAERLTLRYLGWSGDGMENAKLPKAANPMNALGGKKGLAALQDYTAKNNVALFPDVDLLSFRKNGNGVSARKAGIRTVFGKISYQPKYMLSTYVTVLESDTTTILTPEKINWAAERYMASLIEKNFSAVSLSTLGEYCYSNFYVENEQYRYTFPSKVEEVLKSYAKTTKLSFDGGNAYVLPYASLITNVPIHSSGYDVFDSDVPFYQAVLHGWVPYTTESIPQAGNPEVTYLAGVETGSELLYLGIYEEADALFDTEYDHLYGSHYKLWMNNAIAQYKEYMPLLEKIHDQEITEHEELRSGILSVYVTGYANGVEVVVNYNDKDVTVGKVTVPAGGFVWGTDLDLEAGPEEPAPTPEADPDLGGEETPDEGTTEEDGSVIEEEPTVEDNETDDVIGGEQ